MSEKAVVSLVIWFVIGWTVALSEESIVTSEQRLLNHVLSNYSINSRPVLNPRSPAYVEIAAQLIRVDSVSEVGQWLRTKLHLKQAWKNHLLTWEPSEYDDIDEILVSREDVWTPNLHLLNEANQNDKDATKTVSANVKIHLSYDGNCTLTYASFYKSTCAIDVTFFPFDEQTCILEFGSWSQDENQLIVTAEQADSIDDRSEYEENGEWAVDSAIMVNAKVKYRLNIRSHSTVHLTIELKRKFFYYMMNLVMPCALIACMIFLVFVLPPKSGERISLGVTVLLSMAIFQELSSEKLPSSSDNFPLLGIYYSVSMFEIGLAMCLNCLVLNFYHRNYEMPSWIRRVLLGRLADICKVHVPAALRPCNTSWQLQQKYASQLDHGLNETDPNGPAICLSKSYNGNEEVDSDCQGMVGTTDLVTVSTKNGNCTSAKRKGDRSPRTHKRHSTFFSFNNKSNDRSPKEGQSPSSYSRHRSDFTDESKRNAEDWKLAARVLDRALLAISVFTGVCSATAIFMQAKRFRDVFLFGAV